MVLGKKDVVLFGDGYMEDELCGKRFRISPQSFYQVNARQTDVLYRTAIEMAGLTGKELLLDAYCGTGTIGLCASDHIAPRRMPAGTSSPTRNSSATMPAASWSAWRRTAFVLMWC